MMENDNDKLLTSFFAEHRQEIADNGFCFTLALVLLITLDGLQAILNTLRETFQAIVQCGAAELDPKSLAIAGIVLLYLAYHKVSSLA